MSAMHVVSLTFTRLGALATLEVVPPAPAEPFLAGVWADRDGRLEADPALGADLAPARVALLAALVLLIFHGTPVVGEA